MKGKEFREGFLIDNRYQVERFLGQGGVGQVYLCRDVTEGGSRVAVKILASKSPSERELISLREEFALLSRLRHPNLVRIIDFGALQENGIPYLVEEYAEGVDAFTATEKWPEEQIVNLLVELSRVIQYLHARGICHRDLKPSNVMVDLRKAGSERLKVLDFGLARWFERERTAEEGGTVAYTAPEVLLGESAGPKSDLYSLGILAYQLLSRRHLFEGVDAGFLVQMQLQGRPEMQAIERGAFGSGLSLTVKCLLEKKPENRPSSAEEVIRMLSVAVGKDFSNTNGAALESYFSAARFVGRERELALLQERASQVKNTGRGRSIFLIGESGSGKSRCADELRIWALLEGWRVIKAQCLPNGSRSYGPFRQILEKTQANGARKADLSRFEDLLPKIAEGMTIFESSSDAAGRFRDQLTREIVQRLKDRPTILILDDFHWADEATTAVLDFLSSDVQSHPIMMCVCLRTGEAGSNHLAKLMDQSVRQSRGEELILATLPEESVRELVASMIGQHELGGGSGDWLYRSSGGNPFFVEEILKQLVDRNFLNRELSGWKLDEKALRSLEVPASIAVVLRDRLSQLSGSARDLAGWLAVINRIMPKELIQRIANQKPSTFQAALNELQARQVIKYEIRDGLEQIEFCHGLIAEVILTGITAAKRRSMHRKIGEALEEEEHSNKRVQEIAMHLMEGRHGDKAIKYASDAAAQCRVEFAHEFAWRCYEYLLIYGRTLAQEKRCDIAIEAAGTLCALGRPKRAIQMLTGELKRYPKIGFELRAKMLMQIAFSYQHLGNLRMLQKTSSQGLRLFSRHKSGKANVTKAALLTQLSYCALMRSKLKLGLSLLNRAKQCMSDDDPETLVGIVFNLEAALYRVGCNLHKALAAGRKAASAFEKSAESERAAACYSVLGVCLTLLGRFPAALQVHSRAISLSESSRSTILKALAQANSSECLCRIGDVEQSVLMADRASKSAGEAHNPGISYAFNAILAEIRLAANEYRAAEGILARLRIETGNDLPVFTKSHIYFVSASLFFITGNFDQSILDLDRLVHSETGEAPAYHLELGEVLRALICEEQGQRLKALRILRLMDKRVTRKRWPYQMSIVKSHLGEILLRAGHWSAARRSIINAGRLARAMNCIPLMSFCHYLMGIYYIKMGANPGPGAATSWSQAGDESAENPALEEFEKALELASHAGLSDTTWRVHFELSRLLLTKSKLEDCLSHSRKAIECLDAMERRVPPEMLISFRNSFDRSRAKAELMALISCAEAQEREAGLAVEKMQEDHMRILLRAGNRLNAIREVEPLLEAIVDLLIRSVGVHRAFVFLRDRSSGKLRLAEGWDSKSGRLLKVEGISESILEEVVRMGKPFVSANALQDPRTSDRQSVISYQIGTILCAPLVLSGQVLGILYADHASPVRSLSESTINLFAAFCNIVAVALDNALSHRRLLREKKNLEEDLNAARDSFPEIVGKSRATRMLRERLIQIAASPLDVLITGESGTGKELVARAIQRTGKRAGGVFITVDCGSLSDSLVESELFGYRKGAFTGAIENRSGLMEAAHGGTLFLDEISNLPIRLQAKLLRVLQEREVRRLGETMPRKIDVRVIAASNRNLKEEVEKGQFREDLYYRLKAMEVIIPSLRERPEDIPILLDWFLARLGEKESGREKEFSPEALDLLCRYSYPGNVRELKNIVESSYYSGVESVIQVPDLPAEVRDRGYPAAKTAQAESHGRQLFKQIRSGAGDFEALVKKPFLGHQFGSSVVRDVIDAALYEARGRYRDAFRLLKIPEKSYAVIMQFLKRHGCYVDYRPFRRNFEE